MTDLTTYCPTCKNTIAANAIRTKSQIAMCMRCHVSFRFRMAAADDPTNPAPAPPIAPPRGVTVENDGHTLRINYRWYDRWAYFWLVATMIIAAVATLATADLVNAAEVVLSWIAIVFAWTVVGCIAYLAACCFLATSIIEVDPTQLTIRTSPLPWFGGGRLPCNDVLEIECRFTFHSRHRNPGSATHQLMVLLRNGTKRTLIGVFPTPEHAWFFAEQLYAAIAKHRR